MHHTMGKSKKLTLTKDGKQKSISSFFKASTSEPAPSNLFSGVKAPPSSCIQKKFHGASCNGFKEPEQCTSASSSVKQRSPLAETHPSNTSTDESQDPIIIPDTPELGQKDKSGARRHFSSRSFLCSSSSLREAKAVPTLKQRKVSHGADLPIGRVPPPTVGASVGNLEKCSRETLLQTMGIPLNIVAPMALPEEKKSSPKKEVSRKRGLAPTGCSPNPKRLLKKTPLKTGLRCKLKPQAKTVTRDLMTSLNAEDVDENCIVEPSPAKWGINRAQYGLSDSSSPVEPLMSKREDTSSTEDAGFLNGLLDEMKTSSSAPQKKFSKPKKDPGKMEVDIALPDAVLDENENDNILSDIMDELRVKYTPKVNDKQKTQVPSSDAEGITSRESKKSLFQSMDQSMTDFPMDGSFSDSPSDIIDEKSPLGSNHGMSQMDSHWMLDSPFDSQELANTFSKLSPFKRPTEQTVSAKSDAHPKEPLPVDEFGRHVIAAVTKLSNCIELIADGSQPRTIHLEGSWMDTHVAVGDVVHILDPDEDPSGILRISEMKGLIVVNPDLLISGTSVVSGVHCMRRSVLNEKFKGSDPKNIHMLQGSIIHSIFQQILQQQAFTKDKMISICEDLLKHPSNLHEMYGLNLTEAVLKEEIEKILPHVESFVSKYVLQKNCQMGQKGPLDDKLHILNIADIEENVWSPRYGVKGKIDLTLEVDIRTNVCDSWRKKLLPLELKTGKASFSAEHKGQVTLYSMMSGDRREEPEEGILLYIKHNAMQTISADHVNKKGLIQLRNEMAHFILQSRMRIAHSDPEESCSGLQFGSLPEPINNDRFCTKCPHLLNCCMYQRTMEHHVLRDSHVMRQLLPDTLSHLQPSHVQYFKHWCSLLHLESTVDDLKKKDPKELWTKTAWQREQTRDCLSGMVLVPEKCRVLESESFLQVFRRKSDLQSLRPVQSVGIALNDSIVIGAENKPYIALCAYATVTDIDDTYVSITTDRNLMIYKDYAETVYRLDKVDTFNSAAMNLTNLSSLMSDSPQSSKLRNIIIDKKKPEFDLTMSKTIIEKVRQIFVPLNKPQKTAILKTLMCNDYVLIKGYPGTGKTSTIVALVQILVKLGMTVLLTGYTHSSVDNILLKLLKHNVPFVRLGRLERIHPNIQCKSSHRLTQGISSVEEMTSFYESIPVIATTCLGASPSQPVLARRTFDVCIIDEASQVLQPSCFGSLFVSRKFVLVGDPLQLPPVVQSKVARDLGMSESLFARLDDTGATYELNLQYRMNKEIMRLSNELIYSGALKCGNDKVANSRLAVREEAVAGLPDWLKKALSPAPGDEVIFLDTDAVPTNLDFSGGDSRWDKGVSNLLEARIVSALTECLSKGGVSEEEIGVITPYRQQVALMSETLKKKGLCKVEVNTVDQYQGRDKDVILISFVKRKDGQGPVSEILKDERRLNVAVTRPKLKLILIGSKESLQHYLPCQQLINILHQSQVVSLPSTVISALEK